MNNKPTLRKRIADYLTQQFIFDPPSELPDDEYIEEAKHILNLFQEELEGLTVMGDKEIQGHMLLPESDFGRELTFWGIKIAQVQLSHTKEGIKKLLEE